MTCVEKRPLGHRSGGVGMLHHRFPNGFTEVFMDETDREVSSLTDRAFRSLCVGDEAVYNDDFSYGYSPFSCHKPLVEMASKKTPKEGFLKKQLQQQHQQQLTNGGSNPQTGRQKKEMSSTVSSLLKAFGTAEDGGEASLTKNGYSWDKSALLSIQQELSEFSSDYHSILSDGQFNHSKNSRDGTFKTSGKDGSQSKNKNGKSSNLRKLNIKNFFLHSEFSPFQAWRNLHRFPFSQGDIATSIIPSDNLPKWYDSVLYKELTEAHRIETLPTEETCQDSAPVEPTTPPAPPVPPKVPPKPLISLSEKRCSSEGGEAGAPWRRNRARAKSAALGNKPGVLSPPHDTSKQADVSPLPGKKEVEVKAMEEPGSVPSTPFNISQLMTPVIPSRQSTETSEVLQTVLSSSALDLPLRPGSEAKVTPEPPVKRESYKSIASSLLFNLKDNRKRVKSRYSPSRFKTSELTDRSNQSPRLDPTLFKYSYAGSDGTASGLSTPAILKDGQPIRSPLLESSNGQTVSLRKYLEPERPISDDYLISNLLKERGREAAGSRSLSDSQENTGTYGGSPFINSKTNKSPLANKQSYPSLNLYKKASPEVKTLNRDTLSVPNDNLAWESTKGVSPLSDGTARPARDATEMKDVKDKTVTTMDIIRAAKEAISAAKNKALSSTPRSTKKQAKEAIEPREKDVGEQALTTKELTRNTGVVWSPEENQRQAPDRTEAQDSTAASKNSDARRAPPPVPKRATARPLEKHQARDGLTNGETGNDVSVPKETAPVRKQGRLKHIFSARQNNYIKSQRSAVSEGGEEEEEEEEEEELEPREEDGFNTDLKKDDRRPELTAPREIKDSEHIISDLHALKELEMARLGDRENVKNKKPGHREEEAKVKNDLISRELRNIKRGMLSMRGNAFSKREPFAKKEQEQSKREAFEKIDSNVVVNKSLINDNYDKAKMALEEVITERLKYKGSNNQEEDGKSVPEGKAQGDSYVARVHDRKQARQDTQRAADDKQNGAEASVLREKEVRERLGDLRDHNHIIQILSQTENKHGDIHRAGGTVNMLGMDRVSAELHRIINWSKEEQDTPLGDSSGGNEGRRNEKKQVNVNDDRDSSEASSTNVSRQTSVETNESQMRERRDSRSDVPPVPPRVKKGLSKKDGSSEKDAESVCEDIWQNSMKDSEEFQAMKQRGQPTGQDSEAATEKEVTQGQSSGLERDTEKHKVAANAETDALRTKTVKEQPKAEQNDTKPLEQPKIKRKAPLRPDDERDNKEHKSPAHKERDMQNPSTEKPETPNTIHQDISSGGDGLVHDADVHGETVSPSLLNVHTSNQSPPDRSSQSSKSSYFSVESTLHRNTETDSAIYHSLDNLIDEMDEEEQEDVAEDLGKTEVKYYTVSDHDSEAEVEDMSEMSAAEPEGVEIPHPEVKRKILWSHVVKRNDDEDQEPTVQSLSSSDVCSPTNHLSPVVQSPPNSHVCSPTNNLSPTIQSPPNSHVCSPTNNLSPTTQSPPNSHVCSPTNNLSPTTQSPASSNVCSPTIEKPALFKVKDNTFNHKRPVLHLPIHDPVDRPQLPRESLSASERGEESHQHPKDSVDPYQPGYSATRSDKPAIKTTETSEHTTPSSCSPMSPSNLAPDSFKASQYGAFLAVPQENDRALGLSPSSEGRESLAASTADTGDMDTLSNPAVLEGTEEEASKVPSERSGSVCSGNDSQGPSKPPVVPPKSEKALLRAMKLTTRRIQKEEAKSKPTHKSRGGSKHGSNKRKGEKSEQKSSSVEEKPPGTEEHQRDRVEQPGHSDRHDRTERSSHGDGKHGREPRAERGRHNHGDRPHGGGGDHGHGHNRETGEKVHPGSSPSQRPGHGGAKPIHEKYHGADGIISDVPVYKALPGDRHLVPENNQLLQRSQSIDRYVLDKAEHRLRASEKPACDRADPRTQRIERSIMDELQQRGRIRDKPARDRQGQRSRSIDTYISETADAPSNPANLSRQSSYTGQLSRQSSMEHTIVTQSFPMTQRKLLQDPDSGQYFVVDMPVQVKTKTFFDPETGNYVQLPVQPPEGAVPQASTMEVLNTPLVLYHGFVPVPVSSVTAQPSAVQVSQQEQEFEQRLEMARQKHSREGHPYLEPVYRSQDHMLGEFLGTEELDCMS
ncbi:uro-adherence factor A [Osmerus eperlanus]|uniref:uro-adherence factor A n=1 Tax=Osmerus eperlanus TaxID=29151 RepID=UPI002E0D2798